MNFSRKFSILWREHKISYNNLFQTFLSPSPFCFSQESKICSYYLLKRSLFLTQLSILLRHTRHKWQRYNPGTRGFAWERNFIWLHYLVHWYFEIQLSLTKNIICKIFINLHYSVQIYIFKTNLSMNTLFIFFRSFLFYMLLYYEHWFYPFCMLIKIFLVHTEEYIHFSWMTTIKFDTFYIIVFSFDE